MPVFDEDNAVMQAYVERFGPLPDARLMSDEDARLIPDKCREGLARDKALSLAEWGVPDGIPDDVTI